jgi:hypothetical protein
MAKILNGGGRASVSGGPKITEDAFKRTLANYTTEKGTPLVQWYIDAAEKSIIGTSDITRTRMKEQQTGVLLEPCNTMTLAPGRTETFANGEAGWNFGAGTSLTGGALGSAQTNSGAMVTPAGFEMFDTDDLGYSIYAVVDNLAATATRYILGTAGFASAATQPIVAIRSNGIISFSHGGTANELVGDDDQRGAGVKIIECHYAAGTNNDDGDAAIIINGAPYASTSGDFLDLTLNADNQRLVLGTTARDDLKAVAPAIFDLGVVFMCKRDMTSPNFAATGLAIRSALASRFGVTLPA